MNERNVRVSQLVTELRREQAERWRQGERAPVESYLEKYPEVGESEELLLDLIYSEYCLCEQLGENPQPQDYFDRFPELRVQLARLFEVHYAVESSQLAPVASSHAEQLTAPLAGDAEAPLPYGDFQLQEELGRGGMGCVFRAVQRSLGKLVAVKVLDITSTPNESAVRRFLREARTVAQLRHSNIIGVHGIGRTPDGGYFLVMDLVEGTDLGSRMASQSISFVHAVQIVICVAEAVQYAHEHGVIHRDLKPSNVLMDTSDRVILTDFGLAKLLDVDATQISHADQIIGTPGYMAPEQASRRWGEVGPRTDVYGLGAILYALLTGRPPFVGKNTTEVLAEVVADHSPAGVRVLNPSVPCGLEDICLKCLQKHSQHRYLSADEVICALREWQTNQPRANEMALDGDATTRNLVEGRDTAGGRSIATSETEPSETKSLALDENVQFTVYRPRTVQSDRWYPLLAFAHLAEPARDAPQDEPEPLEEVQRQAVQTLGEQADDYRSFSQDSTYAVPHEGELTFVPDAPGLEFNPPRRSFLWTESVHREEFRFKALSNMAGRTAKGRLTVFLGNIILAEISLSIRVDKQDAFKPKSYRSAAEMQRHFRKWRDAQPSPAIDIDRARPYRKIYAAFSPADEEIVAQFESYAWATGDVFLRTCAQLRAREQWVDQLGSLISESDIFQLFWSSESMNSSFVRREWEYALSLDRPQFLRPIYWQQPLPSDARRNLPPDEIRKHLQFAPLSVPMHRGEPVEPEHVAYAIPPDELGIVGETPVMDSIPILRETARSAPAMAPLARVRPPRCQITYEPEYSVGAIGIRELPFVIGVLADLSGNARGRTPLQDRSFLLIDRDNFPNVMSRIAPALHLTIDESTVELVFRTMEDFDPACILQQLFGSKAESGGGPRDAKSDTAAWRQLRAILEAPEFGRLEAAWRGLHFLVTDTETGTLLKMIVLDVSKQDVLDDLRRSAAWQDSQLYTKLHESAFSSLYGEEPFAVILGDYEFTNDPADIELLGRFGEIASELCCPFLSAVCPSFFGLENWTEFERAPSLRERMQGKEYETWNLLRALPESRFVVLTLPQVPTHTMWGRPCWMNAAYVVAAAMGDSFAKCGLAWKPPCVGDDDASGVRSPKEFGISLSCHETLKTLGFTALWRDTEVNDAIVSSPAGIHVAEPPQGPRGEDGAADVALPCMMIAARFMHYLLVIARQGVANGRRPEEIQFELNRWMSEYVATSPGYHELNYPLRFAKVRLHERSDSYAVELTLRASEPLVESSTEVAMLANVPQDTTSP